MESLIAELPATGDEFPLEDFNEEKPVRAVICLTGGELHKYAVRCEELLADAIYVRERQLVRIAGASELSPAAGSEVRRDESQAVIISAMPEYMRRELDRLVHFQTYRRREKQWVRIDCPKDLALHIAGQGDWPALRRLTTISRAPFVRPNGSICETSGYDMESCVFYQTNVDFPPIPRNPTRRDAVNALATFFKPFEEFPFATEAARSAFLANILSETVRPAIDTSPAFFYTAPSPGTGKMLLSEMPSRIVHGCGPALRPWVEGEELRKALFASLLAGDRTIGFDNVPNGIKVRAPTLCGFLTAERYSDRRLGFSEVPALPNRCVVSLTGNNVTPAGDLARRSIVIRLDADTTALRSRRFRIADLRGYVAVNRQVLLVAALTIICAYIATGEPGENRRCHRSRADPGSWQNRCFGLECRTL